MKRIFAVALTASILSACTTNSQQSYPPRYPTPNISTIPEPGVTGPEISIKVEEKEVDWDGSLNLYYAAALKGSGLSTNDVVLVNIVKNSSELNNISPIDITNKLKVLLQQSGQITLVAEDKLAEAQKSLGIDGEDSLNVKSKTIGLARYLKVPYILYTTVSGTRKSPELFGQMMQVSSGELLWSKKEAL